MTSPGPQQPTSREDPILTDVWENADDVGVDADCSPTRVCRNARNFTFDGIAGEDEDLASSWRQLLEREGKLSSDGGSLRDLVLGPPQSD